MPSEALPVIVCACPMSAEPWAIWVMPLMSMASMDMESEELMCMPPMSADVVPLLAGIRDWPRENVSWSTV